MIVMEISLIMLFIDIEDIRYIIRTNDKLAADNSLMWRFKFSIIYFLPICPQRYDCTRLVLPHFTTAWEIYLPFAASIRLHIYDICSLFSKHLYQVEIHYHTISNSIVTHPNWLRLYLRLCLRQGSWSICQHIQHIISLESNRIYCNDSKYK